MTMMSNDERLEILEAYKDLRVTDVRDGMDWNMLHHYGSVHYSIKPLFRTKVVVGIARTSKFVPYDQPISQMLTDEYTEWVAWY